MAVAISGGVDSSVLLAAACEYFGAENCLAIIAVSPSLASRELNDARKICATLQVELVELQTNEIDNERYVANSGDRCFWCKQELFTFAVPVAAQHNLPLAYGENYDDLQHDRPGRRSAESFNILAPLREAKFTKEHVREYARMLNLSVAEKPAAPCLASRIAVGQPVSLESLEVVAQIEDQLRSAGYQIFRVRIVGEKQLAFEFSDAELSRATAMLETLEQLAVSNGYVSRGISAYRSGSVA